MAEILDINIMAKNVANRALNEIEIEGKTLLEWVYLIASEEWAPVIHAKWIIGDLRPLKEDYWCRCSNCGNAEHTNSIYVKQRKYCSMCGAKMDLEEAADGENNN